MIELLNRLTAALIIIKARGNLSQADALADFDIGSGTYLLGVLCAVLLEPLGSGDVLRVLEAILLLQDGPGDVPIEKSGELALPDRGFGGPLLGKSLLLGEPALQAWEKLIPVGEEVLCFKLAAVAATGF